MRPHRTTIAAVAALALGLASASEAGTEIRFGHGSSTASYAHKAAEFFKAEVERASGGELTVSLFPGGQLGNTKQLMQGVRLGSIDMSAIGNPFFTGFNPVQNVIDLPYLFDDHEHVYRALDGEVGATLLASLEPHGLKGLAFWEIGFRNVTNNVRPVRTPDDLRGLKLRTTPNKAHIKAFQLLGANPVPMNFQEVYMGLQTGTIDGQENPVNVIYAMRFNEVQKYLSLTGHAYTAMVAVMNKAKFDALDAAQQAIVVDAARKAALFQRKGLAEENAARLAELEKGGLEVIHDVDKAPFRAIVYDAVKADFEAEHGSALTGAILELRR